MKKDISFLTQKRNRELAMSYSEAFDYLLTNSSMDGYDVAEPILFSISSSRVQPILTSFSQQENRRNIYTIFIE